MAEIKKYILFKLQEQSYGVDVNQIISIERNQHITKVPRTSSFIKGITVIREKTTPIIDLRERLLMKETTYTESSRILVVHIHGMQIGLIVDEATEVRDIDQEQIGPAPSLIGGVKDTYISGVANLEESLLIILEMETIFSSQEKSELQVALEA